MYKFSDWLNFWVNVFDGSHPTVDKYFTNIVIKC